MGPTKAQVHSVRQTTKSRVGLEGEEESAQEADAMRR